MQFQMLRKFSAGLLAVLLAQPSALVLAQDKAGASRGSENNSYISPEREPVLSQRIVGDLLHQKIKYVFVFYQENRSFDSYFGTYPGAEGLFSNPAAQTPGFTQFLTDTNGNKVPVTPFRIGPNDVCPDSTVNGAPSPATCYAADTDDIDHSHPRIVAKMDIQSGVPLMDQFASVEELKYWNPATTPTPPLKAKQMGELAMAYEDCDTIPILWGYASKFTLFDHIFQTMTGPSTPGNLAIIGAQAGQTQWALHPSEGYTDNGSSVPGVPVLNDNDPFWGSPSDTSANKMPVNPGDFPGFGIQINQTYATLPLTLEGGNLQSVAAMDTQAATDLADVQHDVKFISRFNEPTVPYPSAGTRKATTKSQPIPVQWMRTERTPPISPTTMARSTSATSRTTRFSGPSSMVWAISSPRWKRPLFLRRGECSSSRAAFRTFSVWRQPIRTPRSRRISWGMMTIPPTPMLRSAKPWSRRPSTQSPQVHIGHRVRSSSPGTTPKVIMTTFSRRCAVMAQMAA